jgi:hypothetical protein
MSRSTPRRVLAQLATGLEPSGVRLYVAGGLALLLREAHLNRVQAETRIPDVVRGRATEDVDVVLTRELVLDETSLATIRDEVDALGLTDVPGRERMQFVPAEERDLEEWSTKVEFLAPPVDGAYEDGVAVSASRRSRIAGWKTPEALTIEEYPLEVTLSSSGPSVYVPNAFTMLVMKLAAMADYIEHGKYVPKAQNHAVDILRSVGLMTREDWETALDLVARYGREAPVVAAARAAAQYVSGGETQGIVLIKDWARREYQEVTPEQIAALLDDLTDLFGRIG